MNQSVSQSVSQPGDRKHKILMMIIFLILSVVALLIISTASPLSQDPYDGDAAMFQTIGKYWAYGVLPYTGIWDSKGPIIFGINALGYLLTNSKTGIFLIQLVCLLCSEYFIYKMLRLAYRFKSASLLTAIICYIGWLDYASDSTEEFLMPLLLASFYFMYKELDNYKKGGFEHHAIYAFWYGITFSFCLLTRLTNALGLCGGVLVITILLILNRNWRNLFRNIIVFICGVGVLVIPFAIYFYTHGILQDALYGTILYNLDYAAHSVQYSKISILNTVLTIAAYSGGILLGLIGILEILCASRRRIQGICWIVISVLTSFWLFRSNGYRHYGLIELPYFIIALNELKRIKVFEASTRKICYKSAYGTVIMILIFCCVSSLFPMYQTAAGWYNEIFVGEVHAYYDQQNDMLKRLSNNDKNSFIAYNSNAGFYLQHNIKPYYRFFTMQDWAASRSTSLTRMVKETFEKGDVKWIFVKGNPEDTLIFNTLKKRYRCVEKEKEIYTETELTLWQKYD